MAEMVTVRLKVNGVAHEGRCEPRKLLVDFIREDLGLTGTHVGCEHGICGACTIMFNGEAARSCIMLAVREGISAVLCRCTGYQGIVNAVRAAAPILASGR